MIALRWRDVDLAAGRLRVGEAKTDAGIRYVDLLPALRDELAAYKAGRPDARPEGYVFPTERGNRCLSGNLRNRILRRAVARANARLAEEGLTPLPEGLTPHSLRRTCASLLIALGEDPTYVMDHLGHTDPKLTLRIYAHMMRRGNDERAHLRALVGGDGYAPAGLEEVARSA